MELRKDWLTNGLIDFEYKKYILKAYFQKVNQSFTNVELYPVLAELIDHYQNLKSLKQEKQFIRKNFPLSLNSIDMEKIQLIYEELIKDGEIMKEIEEIIDYALPRFRTALEDGKEIYQFVEENCELIPLGLMPLYLREGYFLINQPSQNETPVFRYEITVFQNSEEKFRGIHARLIETLTIGIGQSFEQIKILLINKFKDLPNPAVFLIDTKQLFPCYATVVPVAKRMLVRYVSQS